MASTSGAIRAGGAFVEVFAENNPLRKGLAEAGTLVKKFAKTASKIATVTIGAGLAGGALALRKAMDTIGDLDQLNKTASAFGLIAENASGLFGVFKMSGAQNMRENIESLVTLAQRVKQAASGMGGQGGQLFEGLNVSAQELAKLDPSEQFFRLHEAIMQLEDPAERINKLMLAFGEDGGKTLISTLSKSTEELRKQAGQFKVSQEQLDRASQAQAALNQLSAAYQKVWQEIAVAVAPAIEGVADTFKDGLSGISAEFESTLNAISLSLANGKLDEASEVMFGAVELVWMRAADRLKGIWQGLIFDVAGLISEFQNGSKIRYLENLRDGFLAQGNHESARRTQEQINRLGQNVLDDRAALGDQESAAIRALRDAQREREDAFFASVREVEERNRRPVEAPRPGGEGSKAPPIEDEIVRRAASAGINTASIVGTSGAAQAIAKAMAQGKAAEWEKKNNSVLKDIHREIKNRADTELGVV